MNKLDIENVIPFNMAFVTIDGATISFEIDPSAKVGDLWPALTQRGYPCDYYCLTYDSQEVDNDRLITDFGENLVLKLEIRPEIKPRWDEFWATSQENLDEFPVGHPIRVAFEANIWSQKLEFLAIMKHAATGDFSSATIANDYYKIAMAPVIGQALNDKGDVVVTFALNLRTPGLEEKLAANEGGILDDVIYALSRFPERFFNRDIISATVAGRSIKGFWSEYLDEICGPKEAPRSLIRGERIGSDYWPGTCIYNRQTDPADVRDGEVVLSVFYTEDGKLHIEATGPWNKCTFLETSMMQAVYQVLLDHHLKTRGVSFGHWLYEALFREHLSCAFEMEACPKMKGALFAGRRTGHHIFTLFQTWYASRYYPNCIGTSSFDAWYTLSKVLGMQHIVPPVGTHAHELSMVFMCLYPELDQNSEGIQFSQVLAHYMFYRLVHQGYSGASPMPMLPDTLGTTTFLKAAENTLVTPMLDGVPQKQHQVSSLSLFKSARQDSGTIRGFKQILSLYPEYSGSMMASEISKREDLEIARDEGYTSFGTGGFMGDSETAWPVTKDPFNASMAVKVVRVYVDGVRTAVQPVKLGDGEGKETCDATLSKEEQKPIFRNANCVKQAAIDVPHGFTTMSINEKFDCSFMEVNKKFKKE